MRPPYAGITQVRLWRSAGRLPPSHARCSPSSRAESACESYGHARGASSAPPGPGRTRNNRGPGAIVNSRSPAPCRGRWSRDPMAANESHLAAARELEVFAESSWLVASTLDLGEVLERLADVAQTRLGGDVVRIWLTGERTGMLTLRAETGTSGQDVEYQQRFRMGEGLAGSVLETQQPLAVSDVLADPRVRNRSWFEAEGVRSVLLVPILLDTSPIGIIACMTRARRDFSPEEVKLAAAVAAPAATAVRNAGLYAGALERLTETQAFQRVTSETLSSPDLETALRTVVRETLQLLRADGAFCSLVEP